MSVSSGDGAFCNPVGCCAHGTRGIRRGLCIWPEHCRVLAAALVGWARGRECGSFTSFFMGPPSFMSTCCLRPLLPSSCWGATLPLADGGYQLCAGSRPKRAPGGRNGGQRGAGEVEYKHTHCLALCRSVLVPGSRDTGMSLTWSLFSGNLKAGGCQGEEGDNSAASSPGPCFRMWWMTSSCSTSTARAWRPSSIRPTSSSPSFQAQAPWASPCSVWSELQSWAVPEAQQTSGVGRKGQGSPPQPARGHT